VVARGPLGPDELVALSQRDWVSAGQPRWGPGTEPGRGKASCDPHPAGRAFWARLGLSDASGGADPRADARARPATTGRSVELWCRRGLETAVSNVSTHHKSADERTRTSTESPPHGPEPDPRRVDPSRGVQIVHIAWFRTRVRPIGRQGRCQIVVTSKTGFRPGRVWPRAHVGQLPGGGTRAHAWRGPAALGRRSGCLLVFLSAPKGIHAAGVHVHD
jgi:hypothetical protein